MYAIVRAGGRQEKVAVGDVVVLDRQAGEPGASVTLPVLLLVDGTAVTSDPKVLAKYTDRFPKVDFLSVEKTFGDWRTVQKTHFNDGGVFDQIYSGQ